MITWLLVATRIIKASSYITIVTLVAIHYCLNQKPEPEQDLVLVLIARVTISRRAIILVVYY